MDSAGSPCRAGRSSIHVRSSEDLVGGLALLVRESGLVRQRRLEQGLDVEDALGLGRPVAALDRLAGLGQQLAEGLDPG